MPARPILRIGHPLLLQAAQTVTEFNTPALDALVADMFDSMKQAGGAGLAANQIGVLQRVVIFGFEHNPRYPDRDPVPVTVLVNPEITHWEGYEPGREGCLSVPGYGGSGSWHAVGILIGTLSSIFIANPNRSRCRQ